MPILTENNYGWDIPGKQAFPKNINRPFGIFEGHQKITSAEFNEKGTYEYEFYDFSGVLIKKRYEVISHDEVISVPAGTFSNCMHIRATEEIVNYDSENESHRESLPHTSVCEHWFAENIGMVKEIYSYPNNSIETTFIELQSYEVSASEKEVQKYFPLVQGNKWEYVFFNNDNVPYSEYVKYKDCYEVDVVADDLVYISNSGYLYTD